MCFNLQSERLESWEGLHSGYLTLSCSKNLPFFMVRAAGIVVGIYCLNFILSFYFVGTQDYRLWILAGTGPL